MTYYRCTDIHDVFDSERQGNPCSACSPVVVIDPEDREEVERLLVAVLDSFAANVSKEVVGHDVNAAQAALREFANPKQPEPTARWTLIEGRDGTKWLRTEEVEGLPWSPLGWSPLPRASSWEVVRGHGPFRTLAEGAPVE